MLLRRVLVIVVCIALVLGALYGMYVLWVGMGHVSDEETFTDEYELTLKEYDGNEVRLSEFQNAPLIVFTYASWCTFCADEIRQLSEIKKQYGDRITILAINRAESLGEAKAYTDQIEDIQGVKFLLDPEDSYFKSIEGYAMPETIFIKSYGKIFVQHRGPLSMEKLREYMGAILPE